MDNDASAKMKAAHDKALNNLKEVQNKKLVELNSTLKEHIKQNMVMGNQIEEKQAELKETSLKIANRTTEMELNTRKLQDLDKEILSETKESSQLNDSLIAEIK